MNPRLGPIDLALQIHECQGDIPVLAEKFGISEELVRELLRLRSDLIMSIQEYVNTGMIDRSVAITLCKLSTDDQLRLLRRATSSTSAEFHSYLANEHAVVKQNLTDRDRALALAERFELLLKTNTLAEVCQREGCTVLCVLNRLALLDLYTDAEQAFASGRLSMSNACELGRLPYRLQPYFLKAAIEMDVLSFGKYLATQKIMME